MGESYLDEPSDDAQLEVELKFRLASFVSAEQIEALDWSPFALGERQTVQLHDTFFDTGDLALSLTRHAVRVREGGHTLLVTIKGPGSATNGVHSREELELLTTDRSPRGWPAPIRDRIRRLIGEQALEPLLTIENHRRTWPLLRDGMVLGEVALDEGRIVSSDRHEPLHELEIELKGGAVDDLEVVRALVQGRLPASPEDQSKFARGLALARSQQRG